MGMVNRLFKPEIGEEELQAVAGCFEREWLGLGKEVYAFEEEWKERLGAKYAVGVNSGTAALHLSIASRGYSKGSKILVPNHTFISTATAVLYNNYIPVFVDINEKTLSIDIDDLQKKYSSDCVALIAVHYAGHPCDMEGIVEFASEKGLDIIEDCAHTTGSLYKGRRLGRWGKVGCFSFEEKKMMTCGDGGMIVTDDAEIERFCRLNRWLGIDKSAKAPVLTEREDLYGWHYAVRSVGMKYNMNDLAASIGRAQLRKLEKMNRKRNELIEHYMEGFDEWSRQVTEFDYIVPYNTSEYDYHMFGLRIKERENLMAKLASNGIAYGSHYVPMTCQPLFKELHGTCPRSEKEHTKLITLPLHTELSVLDIKKIVGVAKKSLMNYHG